MRNIEQLQIAFYEDAILYEQEAYAIMENLVGDTIDCMINGYDLAPVHEGVMSTIKNLISELFRRLKDLFLKVIGFFKKKKVETEKTVIKDIKTLISKTNWSAMDYTCKVNKTIDLHKYTPGKYIQEIDERINEFMLTIRSLSAGYPEAYEKTRTEEVIQATINDEKRKSDEIMNGINIIKNEVITDSELVVDFKMLKQLYTDYGSFTEISEGFLDEIKKLTNELNSYKSEASKLPTDGSPNTIKLLRQQIDIVYKTSSNVMQELSKLNDTIDKYYVSVFNAFIEEFSKKPKDDNQ